MHIMFCHIIIPSTTAHILDKILILATCGRLAQQSHSFVQGASLSASQSLVALLPRSLAHALPPRRTMAVQLPLRRPLVADEGGGDFAILALAREVAAGSRGIPPPICAGPRIMEAGAQQA